MVWFSAFLLIELTEYIDVKSILIYEWLIYVWLLGDIFEEYRGVSSFNIWPNVQKSSSWRMHSKLSC